VVRVKTRSCLINKTVDVSFSKSHLIDQ